MRSPADGPDGGPPFPTAAELYDWELEHVHGRHHQDLAFYTALAERTGGPVLELGCGTGRLTGPLDAVGLDLDPAMLARARARGVRRLLRADMRRFAVAPCFGLAVIAYDTLQVLPGDADRVACLSQARGAVRPGGLVALEVADFQAGAVHAEVGPEVLAEAGGVSMAGALVHDFGTRVTTYHRRVTAAGRARVDHVRLRSLRRPELEALLVTAGLHLVEVAADGPRLRVAAAPAS